MKGKFCTYTSVVFHNIFHNSLPVLVALLVVSCVAYLAVAANIPNHPDCPIYKPGDIVHILEHPTDCKKFYICNDKQEAVENSCYGDLEFDPELKVCSWATGRC